MSRRRRSEPEAETQKREAIGNNVTKATLLHHYSEISALDTEMSEVRGRLAAAWKDAEAAGIDKKVAKRVFKLASKDPATIDLYVRSFTHYTTQLGLFERVDEWKQAEANEANGASIAKASEPAAEPAHA